MCYASSERTVHYTKAYPGMSESKDGGGSRAPHLDVSEEKMYDSRLRGEYDLHDMAHSPTNQDGRYSKVKHILCDGR